MQYIPYYILLLAQHNLATSSFVAVGDGACSVVVFRYLIALLMCQLKHLVTDFKILCRNGLVLPYNIFDHVVYLRNVKRDCACK